VRCNPASTSLTIRDDGGNEEGAYPQSEASVFQQNIFAEKLEALLLYAP
jgi:hypothetical protein